ncbi:MAG TPA: helix-turn-helix domain-containing protein [Gemmatimonadaceae bacterium]|nr:helix-turn-helix domain-containing protein [Gemmatimonadaceae bacterium]
MILLDQAGAGVGGVRFFPVPRGPRRVVEHFWVQHEHTGHSAGQTWRIIPDTGAHVIFVVSRERPGLSTRCYLIGARSCFTDVAVANRIFTLGARLRAGALPVLTRFPASDFTDRGIPVEESFGSRGKMLHERLGATHSPAAAVAVMAEFLSRECGDRAMPRFPLAHCHRVEDMASALGWPVRTLHLRAVENLGLSPKRALRIERLHRALVGFQARSDGWAQIAANAGFTDQAHLIREFQSLLGETPTAWGRRAYCASAVRS